MDEAEFTAFVDRHKDALIRYLAHLTRSRERAEELAQDAFVRFYQHGGENTGYLFRIATNAAISNARREQRWRMLFPRFFAGHPQTAPAADQPIVRDEIQRKVREALDKLPIRLRSALVLHEIENWTCEEIARALGSRTGTIKSRIFRARQLMRRELESWWIGGHDERQRSEDAAEHAGACKRVVTIHI